MYVRQVRAIVFNVLQKCNLLFGDQLRKARKAGLDIKQMLVCCQVGLHAIVTTVFCVAVKAQERATHLVFPGDGRYYIGYMA